MDTDLIIYICDDNAQDIAVIEKFLHRDKHVRTEHFTSGEQLLSTLLGHQPDLLILDIFMPGLDGIATLKRIRQLAPDLPVALASSSDEFAMDGYRLHALRYLEKPFRPEDVHELLLCLRHSQHRRPVLQVGREAAIPLSAIAYL